MNWYLEVLRKYADFSGRARRKEYWIFTLINFVISIILTLGDLGLGTYHEASGWGLLSGLFTLAVFLPGLGVLVRRLHDTDHSGWWVFISLVPCVGFIILLVFLLTDGTPGDNQYGPSPKEDRWGAPPAPPTFS